MDTLGTVQVEKNALSAKVWDLFFPTLTLLNFVLGATSAVSVSVGFGLGYLIHPRKTKGSVGSLKKGPWMKSAK